MSPRLFACAALALGPALAMAGELTFNASLTSDYRYRGISQSRLQPALQGGADWSEGDSGWYAGTWLSTIRWTADAGGSGHVEWDLYGGRRGAAGPAQYDVGMLSYVYPSNDLGRIAGFANANTTEVYGQLGAGPAYAKYSYAVTNLFGTPDSHGSGYLDLGANVPLNPTFTLNAHAGRQTVRHTAAASYGDWKLGVTGTWGKLSASVALVGTDADRSFYASPVNGKFMGKRAVVAAMTVNF
ncbi:MAG: TorF family putative porin [Telluria sp.]